MQTACTELQAIPGRVDSSLLGGDLFEGGYDEAFGPTPWEFIPIEEVPSEADDPLNLLLRMEEIEGVLDDSDDDLNIFTTGDLFEEEDDWPWWVFPFDEEGDDCWDLDECFQMSHYRTPRKGCRGSRLHHHNRGGHQTGTKSPDGHYTGSHGWRGRK